MSASCTSFRPLGKPVWMLAFLFSPALPFVCLCHVRAINLKECVFGVAAALLAQFGMISVLGQTNGEPLQGFLVLLYGALLFILYGWHYLAGQRAGYWSGPARNAWRWLGVLAGSMLALGLAANIANFHLQRLTSQILRAEVKIEKTGTPHGSVPVTR